MTVTDTAAGKKDEPARAIWKPRIIGFTCTWCTYAGADLAGTSRLKYPASIRLIRIMCTGRLEPGFILEAFSQGADGVFVGGCHPGDCHYQTGNLKAKRRLIMIKKVLPQLGIDPSRLRVEWISASEGAKFAESITEFTQHIQSLGPQKIRE